MDCVKFVRGSSSAFQKLKQKDKNTFYMITDDKDSQNCHLYIGSRHVDNEYRILTPSEFSTQAAKNTIPSAGEIIICVSELNNHTSYKIGNGTTNLNSLPWLGQGEISSPQIITSVVETLVSKETNPLKTLFTCSLETKDDEAMLCFFNFNDNK